MRKPELRAARSAEAAESNSDITPLAHPHNQTPGRRADRAVTRPTAHPGGGHPPDPLRIGRHGLEIVMAVGQSFAIHREPVGERITTTIALADDPGGDVTGRRL